MSQPLVVLVDADTASGAEWVAAVLQRRRRALIIGEQTAGIAAVVLPFQLPSGFFMYLRVGELVTTPDAPRIHERGVTPDVASQSSLFAACAASLPPSEEASLAVAEAWVRESVGPGSHPACMMATRAVSQP